MAETAECELKTGDGDKASGDDDNDDAIVHRIKIHHVRQHSNWDCGLACVQMILKTYDKNIDNFKSVCVRLNLKTSIWTIDLAYILQYYHIAHKFMTITLGVDEAYSKKSFYKDNYDEDSARVEAMFNNAGEAGVNITECSVGMDEIVKHLKSNRPIIVLIDWNIVKWTSSLPLKCQCFGNVMKKVTSYQGHYILLNGYNEKKKSIYYHNPEKSDVVHNIRLDVLEKARKAHGTDEDIIFIMSELT
ncbi:hypothetical protein HELRODRAFT_185838 [Helobdella robusta]|uniref:Protein GUCD1 n=1 Tax=Helobdella robusta TaxID=6412 RepID=T1FNC8_HELRO|nr:hypothetical protein HELRODRAFT_185838 [Helobdella robusta]ESN98538.1 hypothetical protein HELRODRAFT_185838 [Helobdella robusta]